MTYLLNLMAYLFIKPYSLPGLIVTNTYQNALSQSNWCHLFLHRPGLRISFAVLYFLPPTNPRVEFTSQENFYLYLEALVFWYLWKSITACCSII